MSENYVDLINQKKEIVQKLHSLDARQFGATSATTMDRIHEERKDLKKALHTIDLKLNT